MNRRNFITKSALAGISLASLNALQSCSTPENQTSNFSGRRLILLKLDGGNDGMFSFFPSGSDLLERERPTLYKRAKENSIEVFSGWHLNYSLRHLIDGIEPMEIALLPFVGYPKPNMSHFKSTEIWDSSSLPNQPNHNTGWIGRLLDDGIISTAGNETPAISISQDIAFALKGRINTGYNWDTQGIGNIYNKEIIEWLTRNDDTIFKSRVENQYKLISMLSDCKPIEGFPSTQLGHQFSRAASLILKDKPFKVIYTNQSGYDTHLAAEKRLRLLYEDLSQTLSHFISILKQYSYWQETLIFVYSEFGRTIRENSTLGTDHGTAGLSIMLGKNEIVEKYSEIVPDFKTERLGKQDYLKFQIDFRDIYDDIINSWLTVNG